MLRYGIPEHRLPKSIVKSEIDVLKKVGVKIKTGSPVKDLEALKKEGYKAVVLAVGAQGSSRLGVEGEDLSGIYQGLDFLRELNSGKSPKLGKKVLVLGGGNVAIDCARACVRLGAQDVSIVYRRHKADMPAYPSEIKEAQEEGVVIHDGWGPKTIVAKAGKVSAVEFQKYTPKAGADRTSAPAYDPRVTQKFDCDTLILAIGQTTDLGDLSVKTNKNGTIAVTDKTQAASKAGIFAAGDAVSGPATVIEAIASGQRAATAVDAYLQGKEVVVETAKVRIAELADLDFQFHLREVTKENRVAETVLPAKGRAGNFKEVNLGLADKAACIKEARRCITCRCSSMAY